MKFIHAIAAMLAAAAAHAPWERQLRFVPRNGFCIPNPRNNRAAADKRAARRRRNIAKRG